MASTKNNDLLDQFIGKLKFNADGLMPAIAQDASSMEVLMMAWMNDVAIKETLTSGQVCYFSRSRQKLWKKGETSGQIQILQKFRVDCDQDTILLLVDQVGVACHTGRRSCFFEEVDKKGNVQIIAEVITDPDELYQK